ncbi:phosphopyruvate hydratase [Candidatus Parcubacteria bacterium]|nr:phosphopyruvate hydratase [Candidatus Parcubacteria bacterium]
MKNGISGVHAHEILDSRGNPTLHVTVSLEGGAMGSASVPSGASTGTHEAHELRDGDPKRYGGKGVLTAIHHVNTKLQKAVLGMDATRLREVDACMIELDGTPNKSRLGANAILGVSLAVAHAGAKACNLPLYKFLREAYDIRLKTYRLPLPTMNVLNGGAHAGWIVDFQEFMLVPSQKKFRDRYRCGSEVFHALGVLLAKKGFSTLTGDEGGYAVKFASNEEAIEFLLQAIRAAKYQPGKDVFLAIDPAVSELYNAKRKTYALKTDRRTLTREQLIERWEAWVETYPIVSIEDGLDQDDWDGWAQLTERLGKKVTLVGDDFLVTNVARLQKAIEMKAGNAILIKVNQIGTLTEAVDAILLAQQARYKVSVSHRSGETCDTTIADLAVAVNADFIKSGSLSRSERLAKYNRLLEIEEEV